MRSPLLTLLFLLPACAGAPTPTAGVPDPTENRREQDLRAAEARRRDFHAVLIRLDQAIESYVMALNHRGEQRADDEATKLEKLIRETVLDLGPQIRAAGRTSVAELGDTFARLKAQATDGTIPSHQAIALAALGFSGRSEVMPLILQGAQLTDPDRIDAAVLGLAVLRAPATPPGVLAAIIDNPHHPEDGRTQAAWALQQIQGASLDMAPFVAVWKRLLTAHETTPIGVLVQAVRGLGLTRKPDEADAVVPFLRHPTPLVRMAAALALGRMNAQAKALDLLGLLEPGETVQNVRMAARKALAELAGGADYGYDIGTWRRFFERNR